MESSGIPFRLFRVPPGIPFPSFELRTCTHIHIHTLSWLLCRAMSTGGSQRRPRLSMYARERVRILLSEGYLASEVVRILGLEGIDTCRQTVWRLERHIRVHGTIKPLPKSGRPTKLSDVALHTIDEAMAQDDETTAKELVAVLERARVSVSLSTALKGRRSIGWTSRGTGLSGPKIVRRDYAGRRSTLESISTMSSGQMKRQYRWRPTSICIIALG